MKKYLIISGIALFAFASLAGAQSMMFSTDMRLGAQGQDVVKLQEWLIANGYDIPSVSSGRASKGYYGFQTMAAVMAYQRAVGLPSFGFFGPMTRARINEGDFRGNSIRVTAPNGGEVWKAVSLQAITWTGTNGLLSQKGDIYLEYQIPACAEAGQPFRCMIAVRAPEVIAYDVDLSAGAYEWEVGRHIPSTTVTSGPPLSNEIVSDGQYKIKICPKNSSACDQSDAYFTITSSSQSSRTPVINGIDAPTTLTANQTGTWTVHATDPQNGTLSYSVDWGDAMRPADCPTGYNCVSNAAVAPSVQQGSTFTHSYSSAGTYTVKFIVTNSTGLTAQSSVTVRVTGSSGTGSLRITSPNGGETWEKDTVRKIIWTSPQYFRATTADIKLVTQLDCLTYSMCKPAAPYFIAKGLNINSNSYSWNVGEYIPDAVIAIYPPPPPPQIPDSQYRYIIQICESGTNSCDSSDAPFTIKSTSSNVPQVSAPNGGESWLANSAEYLRWTMPTGIDPMTRLDLYLDQAYVNCPTAIGIGGCSPITYVLDRNIPMTMAYNWLVATDVVNAKIPNGDYRFRVCLAGSTTNCDSSDRSFEIVSNY